MEPKLPRLLEEGRVEVRLSSVGGTHVFEESGIDRLLSHLVEAKRLLNPNYNTVIEKLQRDLDFERGTNDFDAKRLRRLATLVGASVPESDETLLGCAGTVIGSISREVEGILKTSKKLSSAKSALWAIAKSYDDDELRQRALEAYEEL